MMLTNYLNVQCLNYNVIIVNNCSLVANNVIGEAYIGLQKQYINPHYKSEARTPRVSVSLVDVKLTCTDNKLLKVTSVYTYFQCMSCKSYFT